MPVRLVSRYIHQRWIVCALCSLALAIINYKNSCFILLADIVYPPTSEEQEFPLTGNCPYLYTEKSWDPDNLPFDMPDEYRNYWAVTLQDSTFHSGKFLMVIPAGVLSDLGYSKYVLGGGMLVVAASQFLRPAFVDYGIDISAFGDFIEGLGEASINPSIVSLISRWTPPSERNFYTAIVFAGLHFGYLLLHVLFDLIYLDYGSWRLGYYITGIFGLIWSVFCFIFIYHSPSDSPFISQQEYRTITHGRRRSSMLLTLIRLKKIPWWKIVSSPPFLSLVLVYCSLNMVAIFAINGNLKSYQRSILHLPPKFCLDSSIVIVSCIPSMVIGGYFADWMIKRSFMSRTAVKRTFAFVSVLVSSVFLASVCFVGCDVIMFWVLSVVTVYTLGVGYPVVYSAPVDLSPRHAGLLMGIMTEITTICFFFDSTAQKILVPDFDDVGYWQFRSVVCALLMLVMVVPFLFLGSVENQRWVNRFSLRQSFIEERRRTEIHINDEPTSIPEI